MDIKAEVRKFIVDELGPYAPGHYPSDSMPLITSGLIDSIGMVSLIRFLEDHFQIRFGPREVDADSLDTLERIESVVSRKLALLKPPLPVPGE